METVETLNTWRQEALQDFKDTRIVSREWLDTWVWFWCHLYADLGQLDGEFRGVVFRQNEYHVTMVFKALVTGVPSVVFITSDTTTHCVQKLRSKMRDGTCTFYPDKYA